MPKSFRRYSEVKEELDCSNFDCGEGALNDYIKSYVSQDEKKNLCRAYVLVEDDTAALMGYYTLSSSSVQFEEFPDELKKRFPRYPIPVALIGRLALDKAHQGQGIGAELIADALKRALQISKEMGFTAVIVQAKNAAAVTFYKKFGFVQFHGIPEKLAISIKTIEQSLEE